MIQYTSFSREELERLYQEILFKLREPFPINTVQFRDPSKRSGAYIPSHAFQHRVRTVAGPYWSWKLTTEQPIYHDLNDEIEVRGSLTILTTTAEGQGFSPIQRYKDTNKIKFYKEAIRAATSDAFRDAADFFAIGHQDLAPYREWANNPGTGIESEQLDPTQQSEESVDQVQYCKRCGVVLTRDDLNYLELVKWTTVVCKDHVPTHQKKKYDPAYVDRSK